MWYTTRTTAAPMVATSKLSRLSPVTPDLPKLWKSQPPTTEPTIPRRTSRMMPSPCRLTILLAMKPATSPRMIHARRHGWLRLEEPLSVSAHL